MRYRHKRLGLVWQYIGGYEWRCVVDAKHLGSWNTGDITVFYDEKWDEDDWHRVGFETYYNEATGC